MLPMLRKPVPTFLVALIVSIAIINTIAVIFALYWHFLWLDMVMHFLGGVWLGGMYLWWRTEHGSFPVSRIRTILFTVCVVLAFGILWEGFEYIADIISPPMWYDIEDAVSDLFFDALGGLAAAWYSISRYRFSADTQPTQPYDTRI